MLKRLLSREKEPEGIEQYKEKSSVLADHEEAVEETLSVLTREGKRTLNEAMEEVEKAVQEAARNSLRDLRLMEEGRCPDCGRKLHQYLFTSICSHCGWTTFIMPEKGGAVVYLNDGSKIPCQAVFDTKGGYVLCVADDVIRARIDKKNVSHIAFTWKPEEVNERREQHRRETRGVCHWCEKPFDEVYADHLKRVEEAKKAGKEPEKPWEAIIVYAAFGVYQNRYEFCSERCENAFKRQYPVRVHKNCYDRPCPDCNLCIKKYEGYDETLLKRMELAV